MSTINRIDRFDNTLNQMILELGENGKIAASAITHFIAKKSPILTTLACSILLVTPCRGLGSLGLRSCALYTASSVTALDWNAGIGQKTLNIAKVGAIALGIASLILSSSTLMISSLATDLSLQMISLLHSIYELTNNHKDCFNYSRTPNGEELISKAFFAGGAIAVEILALASISTVCPIPLVIAGFVNTALMLSCTINEINMALNETTDKADDASRIFNVFCYLALAALSLGQTITMIPHKKYYTTGHYTVTNTTDTPLPIYNNRHVVARLNPGQTKEFSVRFYRHNYIKCYRHNYTNLSAGPFGRGVIFQPQYTTGSHHIVCHGVPAQKPRIIQAANMTATSIDRNKLSDYEAVMKESLPNFSLAKARDHFYTLFDSIDDAINDAIYYLQKSILSTIGTLQ